jgi:hypothetical protein
MKYRTFIFAIILIMVFTNFIGCKSSAKTSNTSGKVAAGDASKIPDNLKLISQTKVDEDDILYVYFDQTYHTEIYVYKNLKTNFVSIATSK